MRQTLIGPVLVALAAIIWATDSVVRTPAVRLVDPMTMVLMEHLLVVVILAAPMALRHGTRLFALGVREWLVAAIVGIGGSALATILFTASLRYVNPSVSVLFQKLQPLVVVVLAVTLLGEKPRPSFYFWAPLALLAATVVGFAGLDDGAQQATAGRGVLYTVLAAALWGGATVAGKQLLRQIPFDIATFWRFVAGLFAMTVFIAIGGPQSVSWISNPKAWAAMVYLAVIVGLAGFFAYYAGLARTKASITTFIEHLYPGFAVVLNWIFLGTALTPVQIAAGAVLLFSVTQLSLAEP
jgi:drug/metabolite transporter (DMT)-like permease